MAIMLTDVTFTAATAVAAGSYCWIAARAEAARRYGSMLVRTALLLDCTVEELTACLGVPPGQLYHWAAEGVPPHQQAAVAALLHVARILRSAQVPAGLARRFLELHHRGAEQARRVSEWKVGRPWERPAPARIVARIR
jgi:hypothetical protein